MGVRLGLKCNGYRNIETLEHRCVNWHVNYSGRDHFSLFCLVQTNPTIQPYLMRRDKFNSLAGTTKLSFECNTKHNKQAVSIFLIIYTDPLKVK